MTNNEPEHKLVQLQRSIHKAQHKHNPLNDEPVQKNNISQVARISVELFAGVLVGCTLGYYLDQWLDTKPVFFIICFFFGVAGSGLNIYKVARKK